MTSAPTRIRPIVFVWNGTEMVPMPRMQKQCDMQYVVGEEYVLTVLEARSRESHNHYFAVLHLAWLNLPEDIAPNYPKPEHLRAKALVETGWCVERHFPCETRDHALRLASYVRSNNAYAVIAVRGNVVHIFEPMSQSAQAMGREAFQKSKDDVFEFIAGLLGVYPTLLRKETGKAFPEQRNPRLIAPPKKEPIR